MSRIGRGQSVLDYWTGRGSGGVEVRAARMVERRACCRVVALARMD